MTKFFNKYFFLLCIAFGALLFSSCSKDDDAENGSEVINPDKNVPDPTGTVTLNIIVGDDDDDKSVYINGFSTIRINSAYNFVGDDCLFVSLGKMKGLGNVVEIPQRGWNASVAVSTGNGYIARARHYYIDVVDGIIYYYTYARLYVVKEIVGTSGMVIGYTIKCQAFALAPKFIESSIEFGATEDLTQEIKFVNPTYATVKSCPDWCKVKPIDNGFKVIATPNYTGSEYNGTIEFENPEGSASVSVKQKKSDNPKFKAGRGTKSEPWVITTTAQLDEVRNFQDAYFELGNDIDLSSYIYTNENGWKPIEDFYGIFDGKMHTIKGLWINLRSVDDVGLFAATTKGKISNLFVNIDYKGITGGSYVGGICGRLGGKIENCMVTGNIQGYSNVGGICGSNNSSISQCASAGTIKADSYDVGGISGGGYGDIKNCYSIAQVISDGSSQAFGIGYCAENCYFAGTIFGINMTKDVYPIGPYKSNNSYYDSQKTNISNQEGALSTKEMKQQVSFQGWDFDKIWTIQEGVDYPKLRSLQK